MKIKYFLLGSFSAFLLMFALVFWFINFYWPEQIRNSLESPILSTNKGSERFIENFDVHHLNDTLQVKNIKFDDKIVFINFWESWCRPCIAEIPSIEFLKMKYEDEIEFYMLSSSDVEGSEKISKKYDIEFYNYNETDISRKFNLSSVPTTYIVNREGRIILEEIGAADWNTKPVHDFLDSALSR